MLCSKRWARSEWCYVAKDRARSEWCYVAKDRARSEWCYVASSCCSTICRQRYTRTPGHPNQSTTTCVQRSTTTPTQTFTKTSAQRFTATPTWRCTSTHARVPRTHTATTPAAEAAAAAGRRPTCTTTPGWWRRATQTLTPPPSPTSTACARMCTWILAWWRCTTHRAATFCTTATKWMCTTTRAWWSRTTIHAQTCTAKTCAQRFITTHGGGRWEPTTPGPTSACTTWQGREAAILISSVGQCDVVCSLSGWHWWSAWYPLFLPPWWRVSRTVLCKRHDRKEEREGIIDWCLFVYLFFCFFLWIWFCYQQRTCPERKRDFIEIWRKHLKCTPPPFLFHVQKLNVCSLYFSQSSDWKDYLCRYFFSRDSIWSKEKISRTGKRNFVLFFFVLGWVFFGPSMVKRKKGENG